MSKPATGMGQAGVARTLGRAALASLRGPACGTGCRTHKVTLLRLPAGSDDSVNVPLARMLTAPMDTAGSGRASVNAAPELKAASLANAERAGAQVGASQGQMYRSSTVVGPVD